MYAKLKYVEGARPGVKRKPKAKDTGQTSSEKRKCYEAEKRTREFKSHWMIGREWLKFEGGDEGAAAKMKCSECLLYWKDRVETLHPSSKAWIFGIDNFKIDTIKTHENSRMHLDAHKGITNANNVAQSEAVKAVRQLNAANMARLSIRFRNAHAIAKHDKSFRDYIWLCQLDRAKGLDTGTTYENNKSAQTFIKHIANVERRNTSKSVEMARYVSVTIDGATDVSGREQESIYLHFCSNGVTKQRFLQFVSPKSTTSVDIHAAVMHVLNSFNIDSSKLVGATTDGASNMTGVKGGFTALLKKEIPDLVAIHCLTHRLELSIKDAVKGVQKNLYDRTMTLLIGLYYFYKKSPKQKKQLEETFCMLKKNTLFPTRVGGTRWVPHTMRAVNIFFQSYEAIVTHLSDASHKVPKAEGLCKLAHDVSIIVYIKVLKELLEPVSKLSLYLQREDTSLGDAFLMLQSTKSTISMYVQKENTEINELLETKTFKDFKLKGTPPQLTYRSHLAQAIVENLDKRFSCDHELLRASCISNLSTWPMPSEKEKISDFGDKSIEILTSHFTRRFPDCDNESMINQWHMLKSLLYTRYGEDLQDQTWVTIHRATKDQGVSSVLGLMDLILSLPPTSVFNERSFSHMKLIKNDRRARLSTASLSDIMVVKSESPSVETFDPSTAISEWLVTPSGRSRRPNQKKWKLKQNVGQQENHQGQDDTMVEQGEDVVEKEQRVTGTMEDEEKGREASEQEIHVAPGDERGEIESDDEEEMSDESDSEQAYEENKKNLKNIVMEIEREYCV